MRVTDDQGATDTAELTVTTHGWLTTVLDNDGKVIALTGQKGLMEYIADHYPGQIMVQRVGVPPYSQSREGA